ncbi:MAG: hypothetical protein HY820_12255 [Acidobacteria bacterium]|nr:hypothetical protein [Acidobacteriota bacterium]
MKRGIVLVVLCLALAALIAAQSGSPLLIPVWTGARYVFAKLGPTLVLNGNQLDVLLPPTPVRRQDVLLVYDTAAGGWKVPAGATNIVVYVNGLRYRQGYDYVITSGVIKAQFDNMIPEHQVTCDFDSTTAP